MNERLFCIKNKSKIDIHERDRERIKLINTLKEALKYYEHYVKYHTCPYCNCVEGAYHNENCIMVKRSKVTKRAGVDRANSLQGDWTLSAYGSVAPGSIKQLNIHRGINYD